MTAPRPAAAAARPSVLGVVLSMPTAHERQRELVRASLLFRPAVKGSTHRRAA